jgi:LytS/YehU family sensor histidine kinase
LTNKIIHLRVTKTPYRPSPRADKIRVSAQIENDALRLEVANNGSLKTADENGTKIGLKNIRARLERLLPEKSSLNLREENGWVRAAIAIEAEN